MKTKLLFNLAALLGAVAIVWMAIDFIGANVLALAVTVIIGCVYALGLVELIQFRRATASLLQGLQFPAPEQPMEAWVRDLHPSLQNAVAQRIEGERVGLPAPVFTPYLVGLLVMLGLLGTFVGMVDTLQGAVLALEGSTELAAIREGLAAPIQGLSLAFGTSVAGIAASAMLGLNSTVSRRERMQATRQLDREIAGRFQKHSLSYNRQQTYRAMQQQAEALPQVAQSLQSLAGELEQMGKNISEQLLDNQQQFFATTQSQYQQLADSVGQSLRDSLADSGKLAGESIAPVVEQTMTRLSEQADKTQQQLLASNQSHLEAVSERLVQSTTAMINGLGETGQSLAGSARDSSAQLVDEIGKLLAGTEALVETRAANEAAWLDQQGQQMEALTAALREELSALRDEDANRNEQSFQALSTLQSSAQEQLTQLQQGVTGQLQQIQDSTASRLELLQENSSTQLGQLQHLAATQLTGIHSASSDALEKLNASTSENLEQLQSSLRDSIDKLSASTSEQLTALEASASSQLASLGRELEEPMARLIETASETPRAAAEVIGKLREEVSNNLERDNALLEERQRMMQDLAALTESLQQSSSGQQQAIEDLVSGSTTMLQTIGEQFQENLSGEASRLSEITVDVAGSAAEMASLGEAFGLAVQLYSESNTQLVDNLSRIEQSMEQSTERSDEQMSYYVAQAREIIDQSMLSQREIIEELRRLGQTGDLFAAEAVS